MTWQRHKKKNKKKNIYMKKGKTKAAVAHYFK